MMKTIKQTIWLWLLIIPMLACENGDSEISADVNGVGGSLARFTVSGNHLYIVDGQKLQSYDITEPANPVVSNEIEIGFGIETIFPYQDKLFIGSQTGMHIFEISNPLAPQWLSTYNHIMSCDPVVVKGNYAYVTLRNGTDCRFGENLLEIIDISDLRHPVLKKSYPMYNPRGLAVSGNSLFVCEGEKGFKIFDISQTPQLEGTDTVEGHFSNDVIALDDILLVIGKNGLFQYDSSDPDTVQLLSSILYNE